MYVKSAWKLHKLATFVKGIVNYQLTLWQVFVQPNPQLTSLHYSDNKCSINCLFYNIFT